MIYTNIAEAGYRDSLATTKALDAAIEALVAARKAWPAARVTPTLLQADLGEGEAPSPVLDPVAFYRRNLAVPMRRRVEDPQVLGKARGSSAGTGFASRHHPKFVPASLLPAILWHGGEAEEVRDRVVALMRTAQCLVGLPGKPLASAFSSRTFRRPGFAAGRGLGGERALATRSLTADGWCTCILN